MCVGIFGRCSIENCVFFIVFYSGNHTSPLQENVKIMEIILVLRPLGQTSVRHTFWQSFLVTFWSILRGPGDTFGPPWTSGQRVKKGTKKRSCEETREDARKGGSLKN